MGGSSGQSAVAQVGAEPHCALAERDAAAVWATRCEYGLAMHSGELAEMLSPLHLLVQSPSDNAQVIAD